MSVSPEGSIAFLNELDDAVEKLWMTMSMLAERIDPVLTPSPTAEALKNPDRQGDTVLNARILAITDRINRMTANAAETTSRVRL